MKLKINNYELELEKDMDIRKITDDATNGEVIESINLKNALDVFIERAILFTDKTELKCYMCDGVSFTTLNDIIESICDSNSDEAINFYEEKYNQLRYTKPMTITVNRYGFEITNKLGYDRFVPDDIEEQILNKNGDRVIRSETFGITGVVSGSDLRHTFVLGYVHDYAWAINEMSDPTFEKVEELIEEIDFRECINYNIELKGHVFETVEKYR